MEEGIAKIESVERGKAESIDPIDQLRLVRQKFSKSFLKLTHDSRYSRADFKNELEIIIKELIHISKKI